MKHPTPEAWMAYLYNESQPVERAAMKEHLSTCAECQASVAEWQGAMKQLNSWKMEPVRRMRRIAEPVLKWGIAAAVVLSLGFAAGRVQATGSNGEVAELKTQIASDSARRDAEMRELRKALTDVVGLARQEALAEFKAQLQQSNEKLLASANAQTAELMAEFVRTYEANRSADQQTIGSALAQLEARRAEEMREFREELETVAVLTAASFQKAQNQLVQLAAATGVVGSNE